MIFIYSIELFKKIPGDSDLKLKAGSLGKATPSRR